MAHRSRQALMSQIPAVMGLTSTLSRLSLLSAHTIRSLFGDVLLKGGSQVYHMHLCFLFYIKHAALLYRAADQAIYLSAHPGDQLSDEPLQDRDGMPMAF